MTSRLFEPINIKGMQLKNRFVRSGTAEGMATGDGIPNKDLAALYEELAKGEIGLIITSGAIIEAWKKQPEDLGMNAPFFMYSYEHGKSWEKVIQTVHENGAKIAMQIGHLGRQDSPILRGEPPIAPSPVPIGEVVPREMTWDDIADVIEKFARACLRVKNAGFDAVQYHGAHGNLITNFLSPYTNKRTDEYGGLIENRARFTTRMIFECRRLVGPDYPLMIKMNFNDYVEDGITKEDAVKAAKLFVEAGLDCIEISGGTLSDSMEHISVKGINTREKEAYFREYGSALKKEVEIPVILVGGNRSFDVMEELIDENAADLVSMSRPFIREPGLVKRWKNGDFSKATCISCNQCYQNWVFHPLKCYADHPLGKDDEKP